MNTLSDTTPVPLCKTITDFRSVSAQALRHARSTCAVGASITNGKPAKSPSPQSVKAEHWAESGGSRAACAALTHPAAATGPGSGRASAASSPPSASPQTPPLPH